MQMTVIENMRDCVRQAYLNGCEAGDEFKKFRHAIIAELKRLGCTTAEIKEVLLGWNARCQKPLGASEQRMKLLKYVDWFEKKECKIGCRALEDYCLGKDACQYYLRTYHQRRRENDVLPFNMEELERFLNIKYSKGGKGRVLMMIVRVIRKFQVENNIGSIIYIDYRKIASLLRDEYNVRMEPMDVLRHVRVLQDEGVIEQAEKGKPGEFRGKANGYRFLPWAEP